MAGKQNRPIPYIGRGQQPHNYLAKLMRYVLRALLGKRMHVRVSHGHGCAYFKGRACNCNPIVREMSDREIAGI